MGVDETRKIREKFKDTPGNGSDHLVMLADFESKDHSKLDKFDANAFSELFGK